MRWVARIALGLAGLVVLALAGAAGAVWYTLPGGALTQPVPGLSAPVDIAMDADGIPHIRAANARDAAAALGFLHARERMFQMELMRRAAAGELSEIVGDLTLPNDRLMRVLGVRRAAEADLAALPAEARALLDAYAAGVNAWITRRGRFAAAEFLPLGAPRPWAAVDSLLWGKTMGLYLSGNWRTELARVALMGRMTPAEIEALWPDMGGAGRPEAALSATAAKLAAALPSFPAPFTLPASASNEWAVDGAHSETGAPLLAGDPHLGFSLPGVWYLARIDTPEGVLAGATAPGVPFLVIGRNSRIAWTFTTTGADVQDLFIETPAGPDAYLTPDGPRPYAIREERIRRRGGPDEVLRVRETRHGPVVSDIVDPAGPVLALSMANLAPGDQAAAGLLALNQAGSVREAGAAAARITAPVQNLLVADRDGIGLFVTGRVPIRRAGDGALPAPGADGSHDWTGWAAGDQLPHWTNPPSGRLANANERIAPPDFPVFLGRDWFDDWRARRIRALLDARPKHGIADFAAMQADPVSEMARDLLPRLRALPVTDPLPRQAQDTLRDWDGAMVTDSPAPLVFNAWMREFARRLLARAGVPAQAGPPWNERAAHALTPQGAAVCGGNCDGLLTIALTVAAADLAEKYGPTPSAWRWGAAHPAVFAHPILRFLPLLGPWTTARIASPGDDATLFRGGMAGESFDSVHGAAFRGVYDLADLERSRFVVAPGQSGHVASPLARNFVQRWRAGDTVLLAAQPANTEFHLSLLPEDIAK